MFLAILLATFLQTPETSFMPRDMVRESTFDNGITEQQFHDTIDGVTKHYASVMPGQLVVNYRWTDNIVNASAQQIGNKWVLNMYGGLARAVSQDGFALVVCHELGHHMGGYPYYEGDTWAASEGQADYWATQVCARKMGWDNQRIVQASIDLAKLLAGGQSAVDVNTPDPRKVTTTYTSHPNAQCRLDTYYQGSKCPVTARHGFIVGRGLPSGIHTLQAYHEALANSCDTRPRCWFAPGTISKSVDKLIIAW